MFSRLGSALRAAADVIAPPCARVEDLRYHWSQVVGSCQRCQGPNPFTEPGECGTDAVRSVCLVPAVEETHTPRHLAHMLKILSCEDRDRWGALSPCLEFIVTERVLASLASFAWCDRPLGVRQHAYVFLTGVLNHLHHSNLHHARIHKPIQCMVRASGEMTASPYEVEEIAFLTALCEKIRQDHSLVLLYIQPGVMSECLQSIQTSECHTPTPQLTDTTPSLASTSSLPGHLNTSQIDPKDGDTSDNIANDSRVSEINDSDTSGTDPRLSESNNTEISSNTDSSVLPNGVTTVLSEDASDTFSIGGGSNSSNNPLSQKHQRSLSIHSTCSTNSSDSSTKCSSSSSIAASVFATNSWGVTRTSRHVGLQSCFPLVDALLNLCHSADAGISGAAHECLLLLCGVREPVCTRTIARHTLFPHYIAAKIAECVSALPADVEAGTIDEFPLLHQAGSRKTTTHGGAAADASDSEDSTTAEEALEEDFPGRRELVRMMHWLAYCDKVVCSGDSTLSTSLCHCLREIVLDGQLRDPLASDCDEAVSVALSIVSRLLQALTSHCLVMTVVRWICCSTDDEDCILPRLLHHCRTPQHQIQALQLLQTALQNSRGGCVSLIASPALLQRRYFDSSAAEVQQECWSDEEDERLRRKGSPQELLSPGSAPISRTFAPNNINKIVKQFLSIVPEELRSSHSDDFESYKNDSVRQYRDVVRCSSLHQWAREPMSQDQETSSSCSRDSPPEDERDLDAFSPGACLDMLLDLLENLPQQDYDINLQVTSVISCLALLPQPHLHEYLLNPSIPVTQGARTPYTVLQKLLRELRDQVLTTQDYHNHLTLARHHLLGDIADWQRERDSVDRVFEAVIVVEEFCKELAAIAHAKYTVELAR